MLKNSYDQLVDSRRESILAFLKTRGQATLGEVAAHLEVSKQGALRHLEALETDGLATTGHAQPHGRGRPENLYELTPAANDHFPDGHRELAGDLVQFLSEEQLKRFFERRAVWAAPVRGLGVAQWLNDRAVGVTWEAGIAAPPSPE